MSDGSRRGPGRVWGVVAGVLAALLVAAPAWGQEPNGFTFLGGIGYERGGPGGALIDALHTADLADVQPGRCHATTCVDPVEYPFHYTEGLNLAGFIGGRYRFDIPLSFELTVSNGPRGHAEGYNDELKEHVIVAYESFLAAATAGLHLGPIRLEAGPVINHTSWELTRNSRTIDEQGIPVIGGTVGASGGVRVGEVFLSLGAGLRRFPTGGLEPAFHIPLQADYRSYFVNVSVLPAAR